MMCRLSQRSWSKLDGNGTTGNLMLLVSTNLLEAKSIKSEEDVLSN